MINYYQETNSKLISTKIEFPKKTFGRRFYKYYSKELNIIVLSLNTITKTKNKEVAKETQKLLFIIQKTIFLFKHAGFDLSNVPPLHTINVDDGSVLIEWIFNDFRIGFSIEPNKEDSSWYLVSNKKLGEINISGYISTNIDIEMLISKLINFIISNS